MPSIVSIVFAVLAFLLTPLNYLVGLGAQTKSPQTIERTMRWTGNPSERVFELSNISGSVRIIGENRSDVAVTARKTVRRQGRSNDGGPAVDFRESAGRLLVCGDDRHCGCHVNSSRNDRWDDETRVEVDFEVHVPMNVTLDVCTVNHATLRVERVNGPFTLRNVNGSIDLQRMGGTGSATTVNGDVTATFVNPPTTATDFKTVNGDIDVTVPASLSADLRLHTMHGEIYTNFDTTTLSDTATTERRGRRTRYDVNKTTRLRVGKGGPEMSFNTLNGDIEVKKP